MMGFAAPESPPHDPTTTREHESTTMISLSNLKAQRAAMTPGDRDVIDVLIEIAEAAKAAVDLMPKFGHLKRLRAALAKITT